MYKKESYHLAPLLGKIKTSVRKSTLLEKGFQENAKILKKWSRSQEPGTVKYKLISQPGHFGEKVLFQGLKKGIKQV